MPTAGARQEAQEWVAEAYRLHMRGEVLEAIGCYTRALSLHATPKTRTLRAWAFAQQGDLDAALRDCQAALELDPECAQAYNDIGAYHLERQQPEDAIPWLRMALKTPEGEEVCFPHHNLGKAFEALGSPAQALIHYRRALDAQPGYRPACQAVARLTSAQETS